MHGTRSAVDSFGVNITLTSPPGSKALDVFMALHVAAICLRQQCVSSKTTNSSSEDFETFVASSV